MEKKITVAIYSGSIPSSNFIENLIQLVADKNIKVLLFGIGRKIDYNNKNIKIILTPQRKLLKIFFVIRQLAQLIIIQPRKAYKLFNNYKVFSQSNSPINSLSKILPVLNHTPDIFHIQWAKSLSFWFFLKRLFGVKVILSLRGSHINYSPNSDKVLAKEYIALFPLVDKMHAVSKKIIINAERYGAKSEDIRVIYSSLDLKYLKKFKKTFFDLHVPYKFLSVGRFHWVKGYHYCLKAIKALKEDGKRVQYLIISKNKISEELLYDISDMSLEKEVKIISSNSQDDVYRNMRDSDCLILPSVEEGISNVVLEAMAVGLPVISSNCGGMNEVIKDEINSFIFQNRDYNSLKTVMLKFIKLSTMDRKRMSLKGQELIQQNFNPKFIKNQFQDLYRDTKETHN